MADAATTAAAAPPATTAPAPLFTKRKVNKGHLRKKASDLETTVDDVDQAKTAVQSPQAPETAAVRSTAAALNTLSINDAPSPDAKLSQPVTAPAAPSSDANTKDARIIDGPVSPEFVAYFQSCLPSTTKATDLTIELVPNKRRGIIAHRAYAVGDLLWRENPVVALPFVEEADRECAWCFGSAAPNGKLLRCTACVAVMYCSRDCQRRDWPLHKHECPHLKTKRDYPVAVRFFARMMRLREAKATTPTGHDWWSLVEELHWAPLEHAEAENMARAIFAAAKIVSRDTLPSPSAAMQFMSILQTNGLTTHHTSDLARKADGLYVATSMANHACDPNAICVFSGRSVAVRCLRPIAEGDEVTINYVDVCQPEPDRQKDLKHFHFTCECALCVRERADAVGKTVKRKVDIRTLADHDRAVADTTIDPRLLQEPRRYLISQLMARPDTADYAAVARLATALMETYAQYLGPIHPVTLFHVPPALKAQVHLLDERPSSLAAAHAQIRSAQALLAGFWQWQRDVKVWGYSEEEVRAMDVDAAVQALQQFVGMLEMGMRSRAF
ncbi:hypothetical protein GGF31_002751 [Allomyces arbusculus]|nr:hypothetical protein GGF31_002751 [Allomyces arbusculus]